MGVRPDLDLPHRLHGTVLDVADERDEDHRDTYQYLIRKGLETLDDDHHPAPATSRGDSVSGDAPTATEAPDE